MATLSQQYPTANAAKEMWKYLHDLCISVHAIEVSDIEHGAGWEISGPFTKYIREIWPGTRTNRGGGKSAVTYLRQFLRETGNVVVRKDGQLFIRHDWQSMETVVLWRERTREQNRIERKVTPHEAGEDREPEPVIVRHEAPIKTEGVFDYYASGRIICRRCGMPMKSARSIGGHVKKHNREDEQARILELETAMRSNTLSDEDISFETAITAIREQHQMTLLALATERNRLAQLQLELDARPEPEAHDDDAQTKVDLIVELLAKFQNGGMSQFRVISDINDVLNLGDDDELDEHQPGQQQSIEIEVEPNVAYGHSAAVVEDES